MKIGIMGGTFDPIHMGHLIAAEAARDGLQLEEVWFIPCYTPPHKSTGPIASSEQRWEMVNRSLHQSSEFKAVDLEIKRAGISYTIDTAKELKRLYPEHDFHYIIGADMVQYLPQWVNIGELLELVSFIGLERAGFELDWDALPTLIHNKVKMVSMPSIEISSTQIRAQRARGKSVKYQITEQVHRYIEENRLYESRRTAGNC